MKTLFICTIALLFLSGCSSSNVGMGGTEIIADTEIGIHGSIVMGSDIRL